MKSSISCCLNFSELDFQFHSLVKLIKTQNTSLKFLYSYSTSFQLLAYNYSYVDFQFDSPVATGSQRQCQSREGIKLSKPFGYIATVETEEHGFGSAECPWNIVVSPGQRINITLFNFARHPVANDGGDVRPEVCYEIGAIKEKDEKKRITLCDALGRQTSIFVSKRNSVSVQFVSGPTLRSLGAFVFKYNGKHSNSTFYLKVTGLRGYRFADSPLKVL